MHDLRAAMDSAMDIIFDSARRIGYQALVLL